MISPRRSSPEGPGDEGEERRGDPEKRTEPAQRLRAYLEANELDYDEPQPGQFSFALPGEKKLQTPVRLDIGTHALGVHAFVCRRPDENHERVFEWLLQRNLKLYGVAFAVDRLGDIYLDGRLPLAVIDDDDELDRLLGGVLTTADESFNSILELGFASSIRKEWEWRTLRGESTENLEAFRGWLEVDEGSGSGEDQHEGDQRR